MSCINCIAIKDSGLCRTLEYGGQCRLLKVKTEAKKPEAVKSRSIDWLNVLSAITKGLKRLDAPHTTTYHTKHYQYVIGIGNDHVATLTIDEDALKALNDMDI